MNIKSFCSTSNVYIALWLIYNMQEVFFGEKGTLFSRIILLCLVLSSLYYMAFTLTRYRITPYLRGLTILLSLFTVYGVAAFFVASNVSYIQSIYISLLPIFPFYVFTRKQILRRRQIQWWIVVFFITTTFQFFQNQEEMVMTSLEAGSEKEEFTNNVGYLFLALLPLLVFLNEKQLLQFVGLAFVMTFVVLGMKRGAIFIGVICVIWFLYNSLHLANRKRKTAVILLSMALIIVSMYYVNYMLENSEYFNYRIQETLRGNSSGRNEIYSYFYNYFILEADPLSFLFGGGADKTVNLLGQHAHNDWLEIAVNQGLLGIFIYFFYRYNFYMIWKRSRWNAEIFMVLGLSFIIHFLKTAFSMSYNDMSLYSTICMGYCIGKIDNRKK